jgi:hypothetical protein
MGVKKYVKSLLGLNQVGIVCGVRFGLQSLYQPGLDNFSTICSFAPISGKYEECLARNS